MLSRENKVLAGLPDVGELPSCAPESRERTRTLAGPTTLGLWDVMQAMKGRLAHSLIEPGATRTDPVERIRAVKVCNNRHDAQSTQRLMILIGT